MSPRNIEPFKAKVLSLLNRGSSCQSFFYQHLIQSTTFFAVYSFIHSKAKKGWTP